jgi:hypothetical protein
MGNTFATVFVPPRGPSLFAERSLAVGGPGKGPCDAGVARAPAADLGDGQLLTQGQVLQDELAA